MKEIPLTQGYIALVDDEDFERINVHTWHALVSHTRLCATVYAQRTIRSAGKNSSVFMHRIILGNPERVDHRDGNGLNNQRYNLRPATGSQNGANARKTPGKSSRYKGVSWDAARGKWFACIRQNYKTRPLGRYREEFDAAQAYNLAAEMMFGDFAKFNEPLHNAA